MKIQSLFSQEVLAISRPQEHQYYRRKTLMHSVERKAYSMICQIVAPPYIVIPQVPLNGILCVKAQYKKPKGEFWRHENKINKKVIDFVVFDRKYFRPIVAIEYDGKTHNRESRKRRDKFVNQVLKNNGIQCIHIQHNDIESVEKTKKAIIQCLQYDYNLQQHLYKSAKK